MPENNATVTERRIEAIGKLKAQICLEVFRYIPLIDLFGDLKWELCRVGCWFAALTYIVSESAYETASGSVAKGTYIVLLPLKSVGNLKERYSGFNRPK